MGGFTDIQLITEVPVGIPKDHPGKKEDLEKRPLEYIPGSIFKGMVNTDYYLGLGYTEETAVQTRGNMMLSPSKKGANVVVFPENPFMMGHKWEDTEELLEGKLYLADVPLERGHVILFADDPTFRNYWRGLDRLFLLNITVLGLRCHIRCDRYHLCSDRIAVVLACEHFHETVAACDQIKAKQGKKDGHQQDGDFCFYFHFASSFPIPTYIYVGKTEKDSSLLAICNKIAHFYGILI